MVILTYMKKYCKQCNKVFQKPIYNSRAVWSERMFCSLLCANRANTVESHLKLKGKKRPSHVVLKMKATMFKEGQTPWNKGKPHMAEEKHFAWKGEEASYSAKHSWLHRKYGKAHKCENPNCKYPRKGSNGRLLKSPLAFNWANLSKEYRREIPDWKQLCVSCHQLYDAGKIYV